MKLSPVFSYINSLIKFSSISCRPLCVLGGVALGEDVRFQVTEAALSRLDAAAELAVPALVAGLDKVGQAAVGDDRVGDFQSSRKSVHAADMGIKQVDRLEALPSHLGIKVDSSGGKSAHAQDAEHALSGQVEVGGELVGVPAHQVVSGIGVDRAQCAGTDGHFELVHHLVAGERGMIGFEIELEMRQQVISAQEVEAGGGVGIVLVFGRFLGLGLDVESSLEADLLLVVDRHLEELAKVVELCASYRY